MFARYALLRPSSLRDIFFQVIHPFLLLLQLSSKTNNFTFHTHKKLPKNSLRTKLSLHLVSYCLKKGEKLPTHFPVQFLYFKKYFTQNIPSLFPSPSSSPFKFEVTFTLLPSLHQVTASNTQFGVDCINPKVQ